MEKINFLWHRCNNVVTLNYYSEDRFVDMVSIDEMQVNKVQWRK